MKCSKTDCGNELPDGSKYCGDCGTAGAEPLAKCASCKTDQPSSNKFCAECAEPLAKAAATEAEVMSYMDRLATLEATNTALPASIEPEKTETATAAEILGKTAGGKGDGKDGDGEGKDDVDAIGLITHLLEGGGRSEGLLKAIATDIRQMRKDQGLLAGAELARMRQQKALAEDFRLFKSEVESWGSRGGGRRAILTPHEKASEKGDQGQQDTSPRGPEFMSKAAVALKQKHLAGQDMARVEPFINRGMSLNELKAMPGFEALAQRVEHAFALSTH